MLGAEGPRVGIVGLAAGVREGARLLNRLGRGSIRHSGRGGRRRLLRLSIGCRATSGGATSGGTTASGAGRVGDGRVVAAVTEVVSNVLINGVIQFRLFDLFFIRCRDLSASLLFDRLVDLGSGSVDM